MVELPPPPSNLSNVLVGTQETLDVAEHLGDRHFCFGFDELSGTDGETSQANGHNTNVHATTDLLARGDDVITRCSCPS